MIRAAQYLRMSTDGQEFSISMQTRAIEAYAARNGCSLVVTYSDEGISGLTIEKRPGLQSLMRDVLSGAPGFEVLLVYDVSRLGRFQNPDQAAHYEFLCAEAGVRIIYCAEQFANDGSISSSLLKSLKRVMAAEYSRELSAKVCNAQQALAARGFWQGGPPGYGLQRQQVSADGSTGRALLAGDRKGPQNGRTVLVLGPDDEVETVRRIFGMYVRDGFSIRRITALLNGEGVPGPTGIWQWHLIHNILSNEKYVGTVVSSKSIRRLGHKHSRVPSDQWVRATDAFPAIVDRSVFNAAQMRRLNRLRQFTDADLIAGLAKLHKRIGRISASLINADPDLPSSQVVAHRFGSLLTAYDAAQIASNWRHRLGAGPLNQGRHRASRLNSIVGRDRPEIVTMMTGLLAREGRLSKALIDKEYGLGAYGAATHRLGGGRRLYALAGYQPDANQDRVFDASPAQTLTAVQARALLEEVRNPVSSPKSSGLL